MRLLNVLIRLFSLLCGSWWENPKAGLPQEIKQRRVDLCITKKANSGSQSENFCVSNPKHPVRFHSGASHPKLLIAEPPNQRWFAWIKPRRGSVSKRNCKWAHVDYSIADTAVDPLIPKQWIARQNTFGVAQGQHFSAYPLLRQQTPHQWCEESKGTQNFCLPCRSCFTLIPRKKFWAVERLIHVLWPWSACNSPR